jgi:tetratricopeptide (TPR) repeat protein
MGNSLAKLGRDDDAISAYNDALATATKSYIKGAANFGLGEIYKKNGNKSQAIAHFEAASKDRSWKQSALYELDLLQK